MALNFWKSTHCQHWVLTKAEVAKSNPRDKEFLSELELKQARVYFIQWIEKLGQTVLLRQRVVATAITYWKRFYLKNSFVEFEPALVACTALYLAAKVEECSAHAERFTSALAKLPIGQNKSTQKTFIVSYQISDIVECEFYLMDDLNCQLHIFHPYLIITKLLEDSGFTDCLEDTWKILNDSYHTDAILLYQPHIISLACVFLAAHRKDKEREIVKYFTSLEIDMKKLGEVVLEIIAVYELWNNNLEEDIYKIFFRKLPRPNQNKPG